MRIDQIEIHAGNPTFAFEPVRELEAKVEAATAFSKAPTIDDANAKLRQMASGVGADAIVQVKYDQGVSITSWKSLKATGLAVKRVADDMPCPQCAETIKRAAKRCRFCNAEISSAASAPVRPAARASMSSQPRPMFQSDQPVMKSNDNSQWGLIAIAAVIVVGFLLLLASG